MITFDCPHCGNRLEVVEAYAGRDGWCRICKKMVTVPGLDDRDAADLSLGEQHARLTRAFEYAATKADAYQVMLHKARKENELLIARLDDLAGLAAKLDAVEQRLTGLETERPWSGGTEIAGGDLTGDVADSSMESPEWGRLSPHVTQEGAAPQALDETVRRIQVEQDQQRDQMQRLGEMQEHLAEYNTLAVSAIDRLKADIEEERTGRFALREVVEALESDLESVKESVAAQSALEERVQSLESDLESAKDSLAVQAAHRERVQALESDLVSVKDGVAAVAGLESDLANVRDRLAAQDERVVMLSGQVAQVDVLGERVEALAGRLEDLGGSIERFATLVTGVSEALASAGARETAWSSKWDRLAQDVAQARADIDGVQTARASIEARDREMQERLETIHAAITAIEQQAGALRTELDRTAAAVAAGAAVAARPEPVSESPASGVDEDDLESAEAEGVVVVVSEVDDQRSTEDEKLLGTFLRFIGPSQPEDRGL